MKISGILTLLAMSSFIGYADPADTGVKEVARFELPDGKKIELQVDPLKPDPKVVTSKLDNGLTYIIRPNAEPKGRMSIRLRVATGSLNETEKNLGIAHFIEHLVFNGSKHFKRGELIPAMQRFGLGLGGDANAYTSFDETVYMMDLPKLDDETTDLAFTIMRDFGDGSLLEESAIDAERGIIESEYRARDSAQYRIMHGMFSFLLKGTTIPDRFPIGTIDFIRNGKRDLFLDYYQTQYIPSRMQLVLTGDITVDQAKAWIDKYFSDMKDKEYNFKGEYGTLEEPTRQNAIWLSHQELPSTNISLNIIKKFDDKPDTAANRLEEMPLDMAMMMLNTRFARMLEKPDCPFMSAGISKDSLFQMVEIVSADATAVEGKWVEALTAIEQEVRRAAQYGFTASEFDEASKSVLNSIEVAIKTWDTTKSDNLAMSIVRGIGAKRVFTTPEEELRLVKQAIELLKENPVLCQQALQQAWNPDLLQVAISSKTENKEGSKEAMEALKASQQVKVEAIEEKELAAFAYDKVGESGKVASTKNIDDLGITQLVLSNGVKVNLKQTEFNKDSISIRFAIDGGKITQPADKQGLHTWAGVVMNSGGLEAHSAEDLSRLMAGHTVGTSFSTGEERFYINGSTVRSDLELQLKLMAAQLMHPGYREEGEMKFRRVLPFTYSQMAHEPYGILATEGMKYLAKGDKRFYFLPQEEMESYTTSDVKAWIDEYLKKGYLEVSIVGDFDKNELIPMLERTIGAMPARQEQPKTVDHKKLTAELVKSGSVENIEYPSEIDRTLTCLIWKAGDGFDRERARRVNLLQTILRVRLFKGIREKIGEAYSPLVDAPLSRTYPNMGYVIAICPGVLDNNATVANAVKEIAIELGKGTIDQDELDRAKKPMLNAFEKDLRNNGYWMGVITNSQADPVDLDMARTRIESMKKMTLEEMNKLASEIFTPENIININILPDAEKVKKEEPKSQEETKQAA